MQREMALLGNVKAKRVNLPDRTIACCDTEQAAFRVCIRHHRAGLPQEDIAESVGLKPDVLSKMVNSDRYEDGSKARRSMSRTLQIRLQQECGNNAIDQWADLFEEGRLNCQRTVDDRLAELDAERELLLRQKQVS